MIVVLQCSGSKRPDSKHPDGWLRAKDGRRVSFVGKPKDAIPQKDILFARPDDQSDMGGTWRDVITRYNENKKANPDRLFKAASLYKNPIYKRMEETIGAKSFLILSAGWGLLPSDFLTPMYDITFSAAARAKNAYKRRRMDETYKDFNPALDVDSPMTFFGSKDYVPLFVHLTTGHKGQRTVMFNSKVEPPAPGCILRQFSEKTRNMNWQYDCANHWLDERK